MRLQGIWNLYWKCLSCKYAFAMAAPLKIIKAIRIERCPECGRVYTPDDLGGIPEARGGRD